jgi:glutamate-5-semialdehyde dehydrogenase
MSLHEEMVEIGAKALKASRELVGFNSRKKNAILQAMADELEEHRNDIIAANELDMQEARMNGLDQAMLDRLLLNKTRVNGMIASLREVAALKDPVGEKISRWLRPNGLEIIKQRVPIGVIGIIYESRPNVTVDTGGLCLKTSNAVILRGGKESRHSNAIIADLMVAGGMKKGMPEHAVQLIRTTDREAVRELVQLKDYVDLIIPRGGEALIKAVSEQAHVPVIKHYKGICHTYVDASADLDMALAIAVNAKCQRPGVCNAMETLLVHREVAAGFLPRLAAIAADKGLELRGDEAAREVVPEMQEATEDDWYTEYLSLILAVRVVDSVEEAVAHINSYGSRHSDAIVAQSESAQKTFAQGVDSSAVYINASTRFTDGGEFGMGAEIGISTDKIHARGPMGLEELTTYKYVVYGKGQIRE